MQNEPGVRNACGGLLKKYCWWTGLCCCRRSTWCDATAPRHIDPGCGFGHTLGLFTLWCESGLAAPADRHAVAQQDIVSSEMQNSRDCPVLSRPKTPTASERSGSRRGRLSMARSPGRQRLITLYSKLCQACSGSLRRPKRSWHAPTFTPCRRTRPAGQ